ncbi:MAG: glycogen synthase GlgA [Pseudomonadales bacterium]|nr:glycogen synthase GlgA [Pseudomonadales bacterium]
MSKILFATSEVFPLVKTGGLADVSNSLPSALQLLNQDVRVVVPGYPDVIAKLENPMHLCDVDGFLIPEGTRLLESSIPDTNVTLWVVDCPDFYSREGGPYLDSYQQEWPDNAQRFAMFCRVIADIALGHCDTSWQPDIVHCNDWQTGLAPAFISLAENRPATIFTIHNLAYQGNFSKEAFDELLLPYQWWSVDGVEFYHKLSFLKAGVVFSDQVTTVSPSYAQEILSPEFGYGMDGLLRHHQSKLTGVLNGVDYSTWSPSSDTHIKFNYDRESLEEKIKNKLDLQRNMGLKLTKGTPLFGMVCRLVHQKGVDFVVETIKANIDEKIQWVILGSGEEYFENALFELAEQYSEKISFTQGYSESLAHRIEAASDVFVMASRYEPCGLNQIYSLRYGTLPLVRETGGLADTVVQVNEQTLEDRSATGFVFQEASSEGLSEAAQQACNFFRKKKKWRSMQENAMNQDFSWKQSADLYLGLYDLALEGVRSGQMVAE